jgi:DNA-binding MarR family transcriptional regulator
MRPYSDAGWCSPSSAAILSEGREPSAILEESMMSVQELNPEVQAPVVPQAWVSFLRAHAAVTRALNAELVAAHGLTLNDYEVLLRLAHAPDRRLRRVDLAERVLLTASGITRLLEGLERSGFVRKARCASDGRVVYAELTPKGYEKLRSASGTHLDGIDRVFAGRFSDDERHALAELLGRLATGEEIDCTV